VDPLDGPLLSFIVPAYNEEGLLPFTLPRLLASARATRRPFEVIVVDDASTDRTAEVARSLGARVVSVNARQISASRNAGASQAAGEVLVFLDADTLLPEPTLRAALRALEGGAVGGGSAVRFDEGVAWPARTCLAALVVCMRVLGWASGCFLFARRDAFRAAGGFDERYFAAEEIFLSRALGKQGRFPVLREPVVTSGRKARMYGLWGTFVVVARALLWPGALRRRKGLDLWYSGKREA
jgi:glycosyltransferase involved in cell wall biosynthesis